MVRSHARKLREHGGVRPTVRDSKRTGSGPRTLPPVGFTQPGAQRERLIAEEEVAP
jgi:hypothetical protein